MKFKCGFLCFITVNIFFLLVVLNVWAQADTHLVGSNVSTKEEDHKATAADLYFFRGQLLLELDKPKEALEEFNMIYLHKEDFKEWLASEQHMADLHYSRGLALCNLKEWREAAATLEVISFNQDKYKNWIHTGTGDDFKKLKALRRQAIVSYLVEISDGKATFINRSPDGNYEVLYTPGKNKKPKEPFDNTM